MSFRLWRRARVRVGTTYSVGPAQIEVDSIELMPFAALTFQDLRRSGELDRESLRRRAAHAGRSPTTHCSTELSSTSSTRVGQATASNSAPNHTHINLAAHSSRHERTLVVSIFVVGISVVAQQPCLRFERQH